MRDIKEMTEQLTANHKNAFYWTSFEPEKRIANVVRDFITECEEITATCEKYNMNASEHVNKYFRLICDWLSAESRCLSPMITGPAKFPTERNNKRMESAMKKSKAVCDYFNNLEKRLKKGERVTETQNDKKSRWNSEVEKARAEQEMMKAYNAAQRKKDFDFASEFEKLTDDLKEDLKNYSIYSLRVKIEKGYFPSFKLTNNLAKIKRLESQARFIDKVRNWKSEEKAELEGVRIEFDAEEIRYNIYFDNMPSTEQRDKLKTRAFKWSPSRKAWTRIAKNISLEEVKNLIIK